MSTSSTNNIGMHPLVDGQFRPSNFCIGIRFLYCEDLKVVVSKDIIPIVKTVQIMSQLELCSYDGQYSLSLLA